MKLQALSKNLINKYISSIGGNKEREYESHDWQLFPLSEIFQGVSARKGDDGVQSLMTRSLLSLLKILSQTLKGLGGVERQGPNRSFPLCYPTWHLQ